MPHNIIAASQEYKYKIGTLRIFLRNVIQYVFTLFRSVPTYTVTGFSSVDNVVNVHST